MSSETSNRTAGLQISYRVDAESSADEMGDLGSSAQSMRTSLSATTEKRPTSRAASARRKADVNPAPGRGKANQSVLNMKKDSGVRKTANARGKRAILTDISNKKEDANEEEDDFDMLGEVVGGAQLETPPKSDEPKENARRRGRKPANRKTVAKHNVMDEASDHDMINDDAFATVEITSSLAQTKSKRGRPPRPALKEEVVDHGSDDQDAMGMESSTDITKPVKKTTTALKHNMDEPSRSDSRLEATSSRKLPRTECEEGASNEHQEHDVNELLQQKIGHVNKKFEALEVRYEHLENIGVKEASTNFEELRRRAEEQNKAANELIAALRADLAAQAAVAAENASLKAQLGSLISEKGELVSDKKDLSTSLQSAQSENKALQAKLAASRAGSASAVNAMPGSAIKTSRALLSGKAADDAARDAAHKTNLKEEMYRDLTGLMILDIKKPANSHEDVYDCVQTGRNGTLHFYLSVPAPTSETQQASYDEAEFSYAPQLDAKNDKQLLEILPDYLTEDICFPRSNAAKFYARVVDCITKRVEVVEEE